MTNEFLHKLANAVPQDDVLTLGRKMTTLGSALGGAGAGALGGAVGGYLIGDQLGSPEIGAGLGGGIGAGLIGSLALLMASPGKDTVAADIAELKRRAANKTLTDNDNVYMQNLKNSGQWGGMPKAAGEGLNSLIGMGTGAGLLGGAGYGAARYFELDPKQTMLATTGMGSIGSILGSLLATKYSHRAGGEIATTAAKLEAKRRAGKRLTDEEHEYIYNHKHPSTPMVAAMAG